MTAQLLLERTIKLRTNRVHASVAGAGVHNEQCSQLIMVWVFLNYYFSYDAMDGGGGSVAPSEGNVP